MDKDTLKALKIVFFSVLMLLGMYLIYLMLPVISILVIAGLIVISLEHAVDFFKNQTLFNKPLPRTAAVLITYLIFISVIVSILIIGVSPVVTQAQKLLTNVAGTFGELGIDDQLGIPVRDLLPEIGSISQNFFSTTFSVLSSVAGIITILIISIYMSLDWENLKEHAFKILPKSRRKEGLQLVEEVEISIGHWVKGQLFLMVVIGAVSFIALVSLGIEQPLALALIAGLLEIVPILGPMIALILMSIIGFSDSMIKGAGIALAFLLIQQLENNLLVPRVMHKVSGFSPLVVLTALLIGSTLFGVAGALIAVPLTMVLVIIAKKIIKETHVGDE